LFVILEGQPAQVFDTGELMLFLRTNEDAHTPDRRRGRMQRVPRHLRA
jgi:hypothetical protein